MLTLLSIIEVSTILKYFNPDGMHLKLNTAEGHILDTGICSSLFYVLRYWKKALAVESKGGIDVIGSLTNSNASSAYWNCLCFITPFILAFSLMVAANGSKAITKSNEDREYPYLEPLESGKNVEIIHFVWTAAFGPAYKTLIYLIKLEANPKLSSANVK